MTDGKPTKAELESELSKVRAELTVAKSTGSGTVEAAKIGARSALAVALVTGLLGFGTAFLNHDAPVVDNCVAARVQAVHEAKNDGAWAPLPENSPVEAQCAINEEVSTVVGR
jgi:hypothetical protein